MRTKSKNSISESVVNIKMPIILSQDYFGIHIAYNKKYDICGYGKTKERAIKMFEFSVLNILEYTKSKNYYKKLHRPSGKLKI